MQVVFEVSVMPMSTELKATASLLIGVGSPANVKDVALAVDVVRPEFRLTSADGQELKAHGTLQIDTAQPGQRMLQQLLISNVGVVPVQFLFKVHTFSIQPSSGILQPSEQLPLWLSGVGGGVAASSAAATAVLTEKCMLSINGEPCVFNISLPCAEPIISLSRQEVSFKAGFSSEAELQAAITSDGRLTPLVSKFTVSNTGRMLAKCEFVQSSQLTTVPIGFELAPGSQLKVAGLLHLESLTAMPKNLQLQLATSSLATPLVTAKCSVKFNGPLMQCQPVTALDFGIIAPGATATRTFQVQNAGSKDDLDFKLSLEADLPPGLLSLHVTLGSRGEVEQSVLQRPYSLRHNQASVFHVTARAGSATCTWQAGIVLKAEKQWELKSGSPWVKPFTHVLKVCMI